MSEVDESGIGVPEDALEDPQFERMIEEVFEEERERGTFAEPRAITREVYRDESDTFFIGREFTIEEFAKWYAVQRLGGRPFNAIGYHHTHVPSAQQWSGLSHLHGIFKYYNNNLGWPKGKGPHLWVYSGEGPYRPGTPKIYVGTHPAHDGIGIAGSNQTVRNGRWLHIEHIWNGDSAPFSDALKKVSGQVLGIVCAPNQHASRRIPLTFIRNSGVNNPSQPLGIMYHRDENVNWRPGLWPKSCPGLKVSHENLDADLIRHADTAIDPNGGGTTVETCHPSGPPTFDGSDKTVNDVVFHADKRAVESAVDGLRCRKYADTSSCETGTPLKKADTFSALYWIEGEAVRGENRWWVAEDGSRIWMGGTVQKAG